MLEALNVRVTGSLGVGHGPCWLKTSDNHQLREVERGRDRFVIQSNWPFHIPINPDVLLTCTFRSSMLRDGAYIRDTLRMLWTTGRG